MSGPDPNSFVPNSVGDIIPVAEILESIADAFLLIDGDWRLVSANGKGREFIMGAAGEVLGRTYWELFPLTDGTALGRILRASMADRSTRRLEMESSYIPGRWLDVRVCPVAAGLAIYALDITERKAAELALRTREEQLRLVIDALPALVTYIDADERYLFNNRAYETWHGRRREDITGRKVLDVVGQEVYEQVGGYIRRSLAGETITFESGIRYPEGLEKETEISFIPDVAPDGEIRGIVALVLDITERRRTERLFVEANERLREVMENMTEAYVALDHEWRFTYINRHAALMGNIDPETLMGRTMHDVFSWYAGSELEAVHRRAMENQEPMHFQGTLGEGDMWFEVHCYPSPKGLGIHFRDASARKAIEDALRHSEERYRTLVAATNAVVWTMAADGAMTGEQEGWEMFTGQSSPDYHGAGWIEMLHPDDRASASAGWYRAVASHALYEADVRLWHEESGRYRHVVARAVPILDVVGMVREWIGTITDVDDQYRIEAERLLLLEAERTARQEAEQANRVKDEFLSTLSHELRTPLNAILGWSQLLGTPDVTREDTARGMEVIERNARVQTQIIDDLLDMSRIISGKIHLQHLRIDLRDVIAAALETVRPTADAKGVRIALDLDGAAGSVDGDSGRLQQVIWNLLTNAVKFTPKGGTVSVALGSLGGGVAIEVSDEGIGIEPEFLPHIFERFRQADSTTTRRHGGLGLGLAIVKQLVELHGGSVAAASQGAGRGALFTVVLPPAADADGAGSATPDADDAGRVALDGVRILVVDDEGDARELVARVLRQYGASVTTAGSAREALDALGGSRHDLLISDIGMPVEDGYHFIRHVRSLPREHGGDIPALALSAFARPEDARRSHSSGFQAHIAKPFETSQLLRAVAMLLHEGEKGDAA